MFESVLAGEDAIIASPPDERSKERGFARAKRLFPRAGALAVNTVAATPTIHARGMHQTARFGSFGDSAAGTSPSAWAVRVIASSEHARDWSIRAKSR